VNCDGSSARTRAAARSYLSSLRVQLASTVQPSLSVALPEIFAQRGPLATLDHLADLEERG